MDINNLIQNVRAFFIGQYKGVEKSKLFISFEPLGSVIDPADFSAETDDLKEKKVIETLSVLGDRLPEIDDTFFANRLSSISETYEMLIKSAKFTGKNITVEDKVSYIAKVDEVVSDAQLKFEDGDKASIQTPEGSYLPVYGYPKKWYEPESPVWTNKHFSDKEADNQPPRPIPTIKKPPVFTWRKKLVTEMPEIKPEVVSEPAKSPPSPIHTLGKRKLPGSHFDPWHKIFQPGKINTDSSATIVAHPEASATKPVVEFKNLNLLQNVDLARRVKLIGTIAQADKGPEVPVQSNQFEMSFDYCLVDLDRPWFNTTLFSYSNLWYCLSLQEDYFSNGNKDDSNNGVMKCIPTAMIVIKNVHLKAAWTEEDKTNAADSIAFGFLNLKDKEFKNNELVIPGMQIVGWICEVMPKLPRISDPNMVF
jgi:hypothetical protein